MVIKCANVTQLLTLVNRTCYGLQNNLSKEDTYILIFSVYQKQLLKDFLNIKDINILFKSEECKNNVAGHTESRNTVVVFELKDSYGASNTL